MEFAKLADLRLAPEGLAKLSERGHFQREDGVSVEYCLFRCPGASRHVALLTGWDESFLKYGEVLWELVEAGCNVYTMDWRSQGLSGRMVPDPQLTYVDEFDDYVHDLLHFLEEVVCKGCGVSPSDLSVLGHSMGGFISTLVAAQLPRRFSRLAVVAPMFRMRAGMPHWAAYRVGQMLCAMGIGRRYVPGQHGIDPAAHITSKLTTDVGRLSNWEGIRRAFPLVAMAGFSPRWVLEAVKAQNWLRKPANASKVSLPMLLLESEDDVFVCPAAFREFARVEGVDCRRIVYRGTYHEILMEKDAPRSHAMAAVIAFLVEDKRPGEAEVIFDANASESNGAEACNKTGSRSPAGARPSGAVAAGAFALGVACALLARVLLSAEGDRGGGGGGGGILFPVRWRA